jgi:hypothetical protein
MDPKAITKAKSRLRVAEKAIAELAECTDFDTFSDLWYMILVSSKNVYTVLEQGAKASPSTRQWFGGIKSIRRDDALLQYLFEARNDDEHGLDISAEHVPGSISIGVAKLGFSNSMTFNGSFGPGQTMHVQSNDGMPVLIEETLPHVRLIPISARGNRTLHPPTEHLGQQLTDLSPLSVATHGLSYLTSLVEDAKART